MCALPPRRPCTPHATTAARARLLSRQRASFFDFLLVCHLATISPQHFVAFRLTATCAITPVDSRFLASSVWTGGGGRRRPNLKDTQASGVCGFSLHSPEVKDVDEDDPPRMVPMCLLVSCFFLFARCLLILFHAAVYRGCVTGSRRCCTTVSFAGRTPWSYDAQPRLRRGLLPAPYRRNSKPRPGPPGTNSMLFRRRRAVVRVSLRTVQTFNATRLM